MVPVLPRHIQLKLEQTLAQWQQWQCSPGLTHAPVVVKNLTAGIGNFSVLVESGQRFVVRLDGLDPGANGLSRQAEWRTLQVARGEGLSPTPRYFNPDLGSLVCDYLPPDENQERNIPDLARLLRAVHALPPRHHRLDLAERILRYEKRLEHRGEAASAEVTTFRRPVAEMLQIASQTPFNPVLCHNDLLQANRLYSGGRLWALDWEYCAMGNAMYELAVVIHGDNLGDSESNELLISYLGREPYSSEQNSLYYYGCVYRYLELLWYLALERPVLTPEDIAGKCAAIQKLLDRA